MKSKRSRRSVGKEEAIDLKRDTETIESSVTGKNEEENVPDYYSSQVSFSNFGEQYDTDEYGCDNDSKHHMERINGGECQVKNDSSSYGYEKGNYKNKLCHRDHVKNKSCNKKTNWWNHHRRIRNVSPDEYSICSESSSKSHCSASVAPSCSNKSWFSRRIQRRCRKEVDCLSGYHRKGEKCHSELSASNTPSRHKEIASCRSFGDSKSVRSLYGIPRAFKKFLMVSFDFTQYLMTLYSLPSLLAQFLIQNKVDAVKALASMMISTFPLVTYLIDNVKYSSTLDLLILGNGVVLTIFSSYFNNPYGFGAVFVFCTIHFILRARRLENPIKEMVYNFGIIVFCYLCLKMCIYADMAEGTQYSMFSVLPDEGTEDFNLGMSNRFVFD